MKDLGGKVVLSATDVANLSACGHLVTLEIDALRGRRERPQTYSSVTTRLIQLGETHERAYLAKLKAEGRTILELPTKGSTSEAIANTLDAMKRGADVIYQGALAGDGWFGRTDFLVRVESPSKLGDYSYEVIDTKLSREAKGRALLQLCLYSQLLEEAQGLLPARMHIVLGDSSQQSFSTQSYLAYFRRAATDVRDSVQPTPDTREATYPAPIEHCEICHWQGHCEKQLRADDDLSLVAGLTRGQRELLRSSGTSTLTALARLPLGERIPGLTDATFIRIREQARLQHEARKATGALHEILDETDTDRGLLMLPEPSPGDLFVDLEGDPLAMEGGIEYLIGVTEAGPSRGKFTAFWGTDRASEKRAFEDFMAFVKERRARDPQLHVYHYAPYEPAAFKRLAARHNTCEAELDELLRARVFVDLYRAVRQGIRASVESYSIKKLEPLYGYTRRANLKDAGSCLVAMATWFDRKMPGEPDDELKATIAAYNEDDCASTLALRDWLETQRAALEVRQGSPLARPPLGEPASDGLDERIAEVDALEQALLRDIPDEESARSPEEHGRWLLAQLVDWHRREQKSAWWEYFRQRDLSDEDLIEESAPLGGLVFDGEAGKEDRSVLHRYRFPAQDYALHAGSKVVDPRTEKNPGNLHAIDEVNQTLLLKRGPRIAKEPHPRALIEKDIVGTKEQEASLLRFGKWVVENGMASELPDYRAERALLMRDRPIAPADADGDAATTSEKLRARNARAIRLALAVNGSVLPVQGPPGAGKTHLGAEMITALVRAGKRVGIVANSHKVITGLLERACKTAEREQQRLTCIQKVAEDHEGAAAHVFITHARKNADVVDALDAGANVVAGTSWLWAREEMKGAVDVLFVDEAGQISLANVVASAQGAKGLVLLGDPQQLNQPLKGVHPPGADASALGHMLGEHTTLGDSMGIFLGETWRMHPDICAYISEVFYEGRLHSRPSLTAQRVNAPDALFDGTGLRVLAVQHRGNTNASEEEARRIGACIRSLLSSHATWTDQDGETHALTPRDILILTPYNAQIAELRKHVPAGIEIGTVDKFQGQEAPIAIYSLATSSPEDAPRGMEFLFSKNRLNVAISRARGIALLVASENLFRVQCKTPRQMELANAFCRLQELSQT